MSLTGALLAVFIQQWAQSYLQATGERLSPKDRARIRAFYWEGLENLHLHRVTRAVPILIHASLFLFFSGLPVFLFNINRTVFSVAVTWLGFCMAGYACVTLMPIISQNCPYYSPLSSFAWWFIANTQFIIHRLFNNFMPHNFSGSHSPVRWPSMRVMQEAAKKSALELPPDIDYRALLSMFETLNRNEEFEQFFDALPSLWELESSSEVSVDPREAFIKPNEEILSRALIGMMEHTLLSDLVPEEVKQRRIIICTKTVGATSLLGPWWTLHRVLCGSWLEFSRSVHFGLCVQDWKNISHPVLAFYAHCAVAVTLSSVQQRDDHWFRLASGQLKESKSLLQNYFADDDTILLTDTIFMIRRTIGIFSGSGDYYRTDIFEVSLKALELICSFDIQSTLPELQHQFCDLWNQLVDVAEKNTDPHLTLLCIRTLKSIRRLYISLHEKTRSSPKAFSMTTDDGDRVLDDARSYPTCTIDRHRPFTKIPELQLDRPPRNEPHVTASWKDTSRTSFQVAPPRLSTPPIRFIPLGQISPFMTDRNPPDLFIPSTPSEPTSTSLSELPVIDTVTPSRQESPDGATIPIPPTPAGTTPSIDADLGPPRTPRTATLLPSSQVMPMSGGGTMPMPPPTVGSGIDAPIPRAVTPPGSMLVDAKMTMPSPPLSAGRAGGMVPVLKFNGHGEFAGLLYHSPHSVMYEEDLYPTALHLFEARKFLDHRPDLADRIRQCKRVEEATAISAEVAKFTRQDWGNVALRTVSNIFSLFYPYFSLRVCWLLMLIAAGGCLDGRCVIPQVPAARRPARVASHYLSRLSRVC